MQLSLEEKRHAANHIWTQTGRQTVAWGFEQFPAGATGLALSPTTGAELPRARKTRRSKGTTGGPTGEREGSRHRKTSILGHLADVA
jgi:hypothetical protein